MKSGKRIESNNTELVKRDNIKLEKSNTELEENNDIESSKSNIKLAKKIIRSQKKNKDIGLLNVTI